MNPATSPPDRVFYSRNQVAAKVGKRRATVAEWIADGRLRTVMVDGTRKVPASELERIQREGIPMRNAPKPRRRRVGRENLPPENPGDEIRAIKITRGS